MDIEITDEFCNEFDRRGFVQSGIVTQRNDDIILYSAEEA